MYSKISIIISVILVTAAILTVQSSPSSMLQSSYAQSCPEGSPVDASGNCATDAPPAGDEQTAQAPPPATTETPPPATCPEGTPVDASGNCATLPPPTGDGETTQTPPPATTVTPPPPATQTPPPATTVTPPPPAAAPPAVVSPQGSNNTNSTKIPPYCRSCNFDIYNGTGDFASMILEGHNRERAKLGVAPLVWNNELASRAQQWVNWNLEHGTFTHCFLVPGNEQIEPCKYPDGENGAARGSCAGFDPIGPNGTVICNLERTPPAQMQEGWFSENPTSHWLQVVSKTATSIGCAYATGPDPGNPYGFNRDLMYCRYSPAG